MRIRKGLLLWNLRQIRNATLVALPVAVLYALFAPKHLGLGTGWQTMFILGHSIAVAFTLGRFRTREFGYLSSRGYGKDALWAHTMLASLAGILIVWLAASLVIWLGIRSAVQDLLESPYYPNIMEPRDNLVPWAWLAIYIFTLPFVHYAWMRETIAAPGGTGGKVLAVLVVLGVVSVLERRSMDPPGLRYIILTIAAGAWLVILLGSRLVHRRMEVQG